MGVSKVLDFSLLPVFFILQQVESFLFMLVRWYDAYMYSPLQTALWPLVKQVPREVTFRGRKVTVFTANIVTWSRTLLVIPIAYTLKYEYHWTGFWLVVFHDFLDHLDGIVAKVHKELYGQLDDPIVGGFMDAFCDKIVNVLSLWSVLLVTDFSTMTSSQLIVYLSACSIIIAYEFTLGVVRVQDFFRAYYFRKFKRVDINSSKTSTSAVMVGKLKEKLESMGIASLCLAQGHTVAIASVSGGVGVTCLLLSVRLAHSSLTHKLQARAQQIRSQAHASDDEDERKSGNSSFHHTSLEHRQASENVACQTDGKKDEQKTSQTVKPTDNDRQESIESSADVDDDDYKLPEFREKSDTTSDFLEKADLTSDIKRCMSFPNSTMLPDSSLDTRVERVYTIGCFDLFHYGHVTLMERMRSLGKKVIVGVHDSRSIYHLKKRVPIDSTMTRMRNVKQYADEVFCVAGTDPTPFIECIFDSSDHDDSQQTSMYVRGDDMQHFPARQLCERLMTVKFLPYTSGVSSTKLRKDLLNSTNSDNMRLEDAFNDLHMFY